MLILLGNRAATPTLLVRVGRDPRWTRCYEVKKGLVRHARTPPTMARSFLPHLYWRDLADIAEDARIQPSVRHQAEEVLRSRLDELTQGERVTLARRATRGVIAALRDSSEPLVLEALLGNGRLVEQDAVVMASIRVPRARRSPLWRIIRPGGGGTTSGSRC